MKKILIVLGSSTVSGAEKQSLILFKKLQESYDVRMIVLGKKGNFESLVEFEDNIIFSSGSLFGDIKLLIQSHLNFHPNVQINWLYKADILGGIVGKIFRVQANFGSARNTNWPNFSKFKKFIIVANSKLCLSKIIANSEAAMLWHHNLGIPLSRFTVINNFIQEPQNRNVIKVDSDRLLKFGIASRPVRGKGHEFLIAAAEELQKSGFEIQLNFIGFGIDSWSYLEEASKNNAMNIVRENGSFNLESWFNQIDVYCCLSDSWESDSNSLLEAVIFEKTLLVSSFLSVEDLNPPPVIVKTHDLTSLVDAIKKILLEGLEDPKTLAIRKKNLVKIRDSMVLLNKWKNLIDN